MRDPRRDGILRREHIALMCLVSIRPHDGATLGIGQLDREAHGLAQARAWCDRLIVGLNSDASVSRLKGPERPINDLESRAVVLGGLSHVDLVAPFAEDTPLALIEAIRPDVLIKGADYAEDAVVGDAQVKGWGGEVKLAPLVDGYSTTAASKRMAEEDKEAAR